MSTDLEETEVAETEMIVLATDKAAFNEVIITSLSEYLSLRCNGPEDTAAFNLADASRKRLVKFRTGLAKQVKELVAPLKAEIKRIEGQADKYQARLDPIELHLKNEVQAVKDELARREQERADELYDLRKRRWLEATGNPPDFDGFPESFLRQTSEADFEAEIQRLAIKTKRDREETIARIEAETAAAKQRADEAQRIAAENARLKAEREAFELEKRQLAADKALLEQQQRERQAEIDAETQRLLSSNRAKEEADKPVAGGSKTSPSIAGDAPAAAPSVEADPVNADYDLGWIDGARHVAGFTKMLPTSIEALITNRAKSSGYKPTARA